MQDTDLFLSLAEIAGVFVGFGALIATRSGAMGTDNISSLRWVLSSAIWTVIAALTPILVNRYDVTGHGLWVACSVVALVLFTLTIVINGRAPENLAEIKATVTTTSPLEIVAVMGSTLWLPTGGLVLALVLAALGLFPDKDQALYLTAVGLGLFMSALHLFVMVFWQPRTSEPQQG